MNDERGFGVRAARWVRGSRSGRCHTGVAAALIAAVTLASAGCSKPADSERLGKVSARLISDGTGDDVVTIRVDVASEGAVVETKTMRLRSDQPVGGGTASGGDAFFVLKPGRYEVTATPLQANGRPSVVCAR